MENNLSQQNKKAGGHTRTATSNGVKKINLKDILKKTGEGIALSEVERERLMRVVRGYMEMKPIRDGSTHVHSARPGFFSDLYIVVRRPAAMALVVAIVLSGGGVAYAAEGATPGDILYSLKVNVNEEVRAAVSLSPEAKAGWEAERAERRLEEAATLAIEGKLTLEIQEEIATRFENHAEKAAADIEAIDESDSEAALNLASDFEATLLAHEELLKDLDGDGRENITERVRSKSDRIKNVRARAEGKFAFDDSALRSAKSAPETATFSMTAPAPEADVVSLAVSAEEPPAFKNEAYEKAAIRMKEAAAESLEKAEKAYARVSGGLGAEGQVRAEAQIAESAALLENGGALLAAGDFAGALAVYRESMGISQKLVVFLKAGTRLKVNTLVPVGNVFVKPRGDSNELEVEIEHGIEVEPGDDKGGSGEDDTDDGRDGDSRRGVKINIGI